MRSLVFTRSSEGHFEAISVARQNGNSIDLESVPTEALISPSLWSFSRDTVFADGKASFSLHVAGGATSIGGGAFGAQTIQSLPISTSFEDFLIQSIQRLDTIVDADFTIRTDGSHGEINFYLDQEIALNSEDQAILGLAISNYDHIQGGWWETLLNAPGFQGNTAYMQYAALHEFGHAFGLEHPFESGDGDVYKSTDPYSSAFPEQTVMAYRAPITGEWPTWYSDSDVEALIELLGKEAKYYSNAADTITGNNYSEKIKSLSGNDIVYGLNGKDDIEGGEGDDELYGNTGDDMITGGHGRDKIYGGKDNDIIFGNQDNDWITGNTGKDIIYGGKGDDILHGGKDDDYIFGNIGNDRLSGDLGNDTLAGGYGADTFMITAGHDRVIDFSQTEGDRLAIQSGQYYWIEGSQEGTKITSKDWSILLVNFFTESIEFSQFITIENI